jgi:magnesium-transporting ATPase (P-type)
MAIKLEPQKLLAVSVISFVIVEALSWLLNKISPDIPFLKGGWILILFGIVILLTTLYNFGIEITNIKIQQVIFMILVMAILVLLYIFLPQIVPQIFSIIPGSEVSNGVREFLTKTIGSVMGVSSGVI